MTVKHWDTIVVLPIGVGGYNGLWRIVATETIPAPTAEHASLLSTIRYYVHARGGTVSQRTSRESAFFPPANDHDNQCRLGDESRPSVLADLSTAGLIGPAGSTDPLVFPLDTPVKLYSKHAAMRNEINNGCPDDPAL